MTKNQILNTNCQQKFCWRFKSKRLSSSFFKLYQQQKTLADIWCLVQYPRSSYATPSYAIFAATLFWIGSNVCRYLFFSHLLNEHKNYNRYERFYKKIIREFFFKSVPFFKRTNVVVLFFSGSDQANLNFYAKIQNWLKMSKGNNTSGKKNLPMPGAKTRSAGFLFRLNLQIISKKGFHSNNKSHKSRIKWRLM